MVNLSAHPYAETAAVFWVFSAAISSMPDPVATSGGFYRWLYAFTHTLSGDLSAYLQKTQPSLLPPTQPLIVAK
jgi:hypothetical protein